MKASKVKDLMVALADYATVSQDADLYEAVCALKKAQANFQQNRYLHRAILVYGENQKIIGKVGIYDVLLGLEPKYKHIDLEKFASLGYGSNFTRSALEKYNLWQKPMEDICRKASSIRVKDIMNTPSQGEFVDEEASLDEAMHHFVVGHHQSLLVTRGKEITGILRLTDVFNEICNAIEACRIGPDAKDKRT